MYGMSYRGRSGIFTLSGKQLAIVLFTELLVDSHTSRNWHRDRDECGLTEKEMLDERSEGWMDRWARVCVCQSLCHELTLEI